MSAGNGSPAASHNQTSVGYSIFSAPNSAIQPKGVFRVESAAIDNSVHNLRDVMRSELYLVLQNAREDTFHRNAILLKAANINDHSTEHQDRDAYMVMRLFEAFPHKLNPKLLEPVLAASMVHDRQYIPAARMHAITQLGRLSEDFNHDGEGGSVTHQKMLPFIGDAWAAWNTFLGQLNTLEDEPLEDVQDLWNDGSFPEQIDKKALDPHAELGGDMMREWVELEEMAPGFGEWDQDQKKIAALTIQDHSNGSAFNPFTSPLEAQILRLVDKLENTYRRVPEWMFNKKILTDPNSCHRFVPTAIRSMALKIDHNTKTFTVDYEVNPAVVEEIMQKIDPSFRYTNERFLVEFEQAYGSKSMRIAADVVDKLFAEEGLFYSENANFQVRITFPDGSQQVNYYDRLPAPPIYD